jgi:hypothetical protein
LLKIQWKDKSNNRLAEDEAEVAPCGATSVLPCLPG